MYICKDCGAAFQAPEIVARYLAEDVSDTGAYTAYGDSHCEILERCPQCSNTFIEGVPDDTPVCDVCGQHVLAELAVHEDKRILCPACAAFYRIER